jgi:hypothetical protein
MITASSFFCEAEAKPQLSNMRENKCMKGRLNLRLHHYVITLLIDSFIPNHNTENIATEDMAWYLPWGP